MADKNVNIKIGSSANPAGVNTALGWLGQIKTGVGAIAGMIGYQFLAEGISRIINFGKSSVMAFAEAQDGEMKLSTALANGGDNVKRYMVAYKALANSIQETTRYEDDAVLAQMAHARALGVSADKIPIYTKAAVGLSAKLGVDLDAAMHMVIKASNGVYMGFETASGGMKLLGSDTEKFNSILRYGISGMKNAEAASKSLSGTADQLANTWGNAKEELGGYISEILSLPEAMASANKAIKGLTENVQLKEAIKGGTSQYAEGLKQSVKTLNPAGILMSGIKSLAGFAGGATSGVSTRKISESITDIIPRETVTATSGRATNMPMQAYMDVLIRQAKAQEATAKNTGSLPALSNPQ